jgi:hypothetical protein
MLKRRTASAPKEREAPDVDLSEVTGILRVVSRSLGVFALRMAPSRPRNDTDRIKFLVGLGFDRNAIAGILNINPRTVSVRLSEIRAGIHQRRARGKN